MQDTADIKQLGSPQSPQIIDDDGIDIWSYLRIVQRHWLLIILLSILAVGVTAFITLRMTKIYRATTTIRIETQAPKVLGRDVENVVEMGTGSFWSNVEFYETQYRIIESRDVVSRVVREFKLNEDMEFLSIPPEARADFKSISIEDATIVLQGKLTVEPVKDSRLVKIHLDGPDPHRAQLYSNAIAKAYVDKNLEGMLQSTVDAVDWLSKQLDDAHNKLTSSEEALRTFKKEKGILSISLEDRQNILTAQMTAAAAKLTEARAERIAIHARKEAISQVVHIEDPMAIPLDAINSSGLIQQLKQDYGKLSQEYGELSERYGGNFPAMLELKAKLKRIEKDISREVQNILLAVDANLTAAEATEAGLKKTLAEFRALALALTQKQMAYYQIDRERKNNEKIYDLLLGRSKEAGLSRLLKVNNVHILDPALLPEAPIKPKLQLNLMLALVIGLLIGLAAALLLEFADRSIKTQDDVEGLGIAFLGIVPSIDASTTKPGNYGYYTHGKGKQSKKKKNKAKKQAGGNGKEPINYDTFVKDYPKSQVAESLRAIRTNLFFMSADKPAKRILVTSPSPQEGKTTVAVNLAITMARSGAKVLLIDTDMRRPRVHKAFGLRPSKGMSTMVLGESTAEESIIKTEVTNLDVLMCGPTPPNPAELMHTESFIKVIDSLSEQYDHLIFDSPPVAVVTDAAILSKLVDGTIIILKSLNTTRDSARHAVGVLKDIESTILGAVLNDLDLSNRKYGQHYYYYYYKKYGYYYGSDDEEGDTLPPPEDEEQPTAV